MAMALSLFNKYKNSASSSSPYRGFFFIKSRFSSTKSLLFSVFPTPWGSKYRGPLLEVKDLRAVIAESNQEILKGVNLNVLPGEVRSITGKDGSGKSTLLKVLLGHPDYRVTAGSIFFKGNNLLHLSPEERSSLGGFISFPRCDTSDGPMISHFGCPDMFARMHKDIRKEQIADTKAEEFSGGEEKPNKMLQFAVLGGELGILDEIDSRLKHDEMEGVLMGMNKLLATTNYYGLMITHYQQLLELSLPLPSYTHAMEDGKIPKPAPPHNIRNARC